MRIRVVRLEGESLNQLFAILADWNQVLSNIPLEAMEDFPDPESPEPSGP